MNTYSLVCYSAASIALAARAFGDAEAHEPGFRQRPRLPVERAQFGYAGAIIVLSIPYPSASGQSVLRGCQVPVYFPMARRQPRFTRQRVRARRRAMCWDRVRKLSGNIYWMKLKNANGTTDIKNIYIRMPGLPDAG